MAPVLNDIKEMIVKAAVLTVPDAAPSYGEFPEPLHEHQHQRVSLVAAGLHPVVRALATGEHYGSRHAWPLIPGIDAVARTSDGQLVYTGFTQHPYGTFAETLSVPMTLPLPEGADPIQVAAALNPGLSSWLPLRAHARHAELTSILVLGATGVAGTLAVQNAYTLGAGHVIAAGRNTATLDALAAPATTVRLTGDPEADATSLSDAVAKHRPSLILDFLWGPPAEALFAALTRSGLDEDQQPIRYVEIGQSAGATAAVPADLLRSTAITIAGSGAGSAPIEEIMAELPQYMARIADGTVRVPVEVYPLNRVDAAWQASTPGRRVVIVPDQGQTSST
jgi:NADPH:quinone reductase-like Zn-dependent oxidoreductase